MSTNTLQNDLVVVGVDGSKQSNDALTWAASEAHQRGSKLRLVHAIHPLSGAEVRWLAGAGAEPSRVRAEAQQDAAALLDEAGRLVRTGHPEVSVAEVVEIGDPREVLLRQALEADLVVVGSRGHGPLGSLLLGSVGVALVRHAERPVAVVRPTSGLPVGNVIAAMTLSARSIPVLRAAMAEAERKALPLLVVNCLWEPGVAASRWSDLTEDDARYPGRLSAVDQMLEPLRAERPDVEVDVRLTRGRGDQCIIDHASGAALVVIGRGTAQAGSPIGLGAVATTVVEHADCTVMVVPSVDAT